MTSPLLTLNDQRQIPQLGFGVWQVADDIAADVVGQAFAAGYRHIDTAEIYKNEVGVGRAIAESGIPRKELFITTKVFSPDHGRERTLRAIDGSLQRLGLSYVDLYLIHWPSAHRGLFVETWATLVELQKEGRVKSIGVSNFQPDHLRRIMDETGVAPAVNQIELHPKFQQRELREFHARHNIATESWSPLGQGTILENAILKEVAAKHGKTVAQIIIRWHIDQGLVVIPKSVTPARIVENFDVFDFALDAEDLEKIASLDDANGRIGPHPDTANF